VLLIYQNIKKFKIMEIYVGNLPWSVSDQDLADTFKEFGSVDRASVIVERPSGRSKGFGFVTMNDNAEATAAIEALNGTELGGRPLKVNEARPKD
jgi:cold-inducible RNA-binding protein